MNRFKLIVAGSRSMDSEMDYLRLKETFRNEALPEIFRRLGGTHLTQIELITGDASRGADRMAYTLAVPGMQVVSMPAAWADVDAPGASVKIRNGRAYNARAGIQRNTTMAIIADGLLVMWDQQSPGTRHMIEEMQRRNKPIWFVPPEGQHHGHH